MPGPTQCTPFPSRANIVAEALETAPGVSVGVPAVAAHATVVPNEGLISTGTLKQVDGHRKTVCSTDVRNTV